MSSSPPSSPTIPLPNMIIPPHKPRVVRSLAAPLTVDTSVPPSTSAAVRSSYSVVNIIGWSAVPTALSLPPLATISAVASTGLAVKAAFTTVPALIVNVAPSWTTILPEIVLFPSQVVFEEISVTVAAYKYDPIVAFTEQSSSVVLHPSTEEIVHSETSKVVFGPLSNFLCAYESL